MRKPWEIWRGPHGIGRYHRDVSMVFTDEVESFKISDIAVYADDGSDVRFEYTATDLGESSQSRESISAFVYRAKDVLDQEWDVVSRRALHEKPGAKETQPFPLPTYYPRTSREMAMIVPAGAGDPGSTFFQVILFHQSGWAVRIEISCPANDVASAQRNTLVFLREIRVRG